MDLNELFADMIGYDVASINIEDNINIYGHFLESPLEERMIRMFKYEPVGDNSTKPYQANWMISDNRLYLLYVNAKLHGEFLFTTDIVPEYDDEDDEEHENLFHFKQFTSKLEFVINSIEKNDNVRLPFKIGETKVLIFQNGMLAEIQ